MIDIVTPTCPDCGEYAWWDNVDYGWYCGEGACRHDGPIEGPASPYVQAIAHSADITLNILGMELFDECK